MKKIILTILFIVMLQVSSITPSSALVVSCPECGKWWNEIAAFGRQGLQYAKDTITSSASVTTALQQTLSTINDTVIIPMKNASTLLTIIKSGDTVKNLITGSLGTDPLLIKKPELYYNNIKSDVEKAGLGDIAYQDGPFANSVLSSLITQTKNSNADLSTKLTKIGASSIPSIRQKNACSDEFISSLAREEVAVEGQPLNAAKYVERKSYFYDAFCLKDPNTDKATADALTQLAANRSNLGGWDEWGAMTMGGDTGYQKMVASRLAIDEAANNAVELAKADLQNGKGIKSLTVCTKRAQFDIGGAPYEDPSSAPCLSSEIQQTADSLNQAYQDALGAPLKTALASFGTTGLGSLLGTAMDVFQSVNSIRGSVASLGGALTSNTSVTTSATSKPVNNLANDPGTKTTLTKVPNQQLKAHGDALSVIERIDLDYAIEISSYQNQLNVMKSCYENLFASSTDSDTRLVSAMSYYDSMTERNRGLRSNIDTELSLLATTRTLINTTLQSISNSQSSDEILNIFTAYQDRVDQELLPNTALASQREADYITFKGNNEMSINQGGTLFSYKETCSTIARERYQQNYNQGGF